MSKTLIIALLAMLVVSCRAKKETIQTESNRSRTDSSATSFKHGLTADSFKQSDAEVTTWEYEYPDQTAEEKQRGEKPKPRLKKKTVAVLHQKETKRTADSTVATATRLKKQDNKKTTVKHLEVKPGSGFRLWLIMTFVVLAIALGVVYKFDLFAKFKSR